MRKIISKKRYFSLGAFLLNINQEKPEKILKLEKLTCAEADLHKSQE